MPFAFAASDPVAAYLERFADAPAVLAGLGIDPLRDMDRPIAGDDSDDLLDRLALTLQASRWEETDEDWTAADLEELVLHICGTHHQYLRSELPRLLRLTHRLSQNDDAVAQELHQRLQRVASTILSHLELEEERLFPACKALGTVSRGGPPPSSSQLTISAHELQHGHEQIGSEWPQLIDLCRQSGDDPQHLGLREVLLRGLLAVADDLRQHHYEEEECLVPAALHCLELIHHPLRRREEGRP